MHQCVFVFVVTLSSLMRFCFIFRKDSYKKKSKLVLFSEIEGSSISGVLLVITSMQMNLGKGNLYATGIMVTMQHCSLEL